MNLRIRHPALVLSLYILLLWQDGTGLFRMGVAASLLHEAGHVLVWLLLQKKPPRLTLSAGGIGLDTRGALLHSGGEALLAAAGPLTNFILCAGLLGLMQLRASCMGYFFAGANLLVGGFNLLPFGTLDGRILLNLAFDKIAMWAKTV